MGLNRISKKKVENFSSFMAETKSIAVVAHTAPGGPVIYNGQEAKSAASDHLTYEFELIMNGNIIVYSADGTSAPMKNQRVSLPAGSDVADLTDPRGHYRMFYNHQGLYAHEKKSFGDYGIECNGQVYPIQCSMRIGGAPSVSDYVGSVVIGDHVISGKDWCHRMHRRAAELQVQTGLIDFKKTPICITFNYTPGGYRLDPKRINSINTCIFDYKTARRIDCDIKVQLPEMNDVYSQYVVTLAPKIKKIAAGDVWVLSLGDSTAVVRQAIEKELLEAKGQVKKEEPHHFIHEGSYYLMNPYSCSLREDDKEAAWSSTWRQPIGGAMAFVF
jgi:hypothetical protein